MTTPGGEPDDSGLGAIWRDGGVDFLLRAPDASAVELCLFTANDPQTEYRRIALERDGEGVWRTRVESAGPGLLYGYRVDGPFDPSRGLRFDPAKLLVDPRAGTIRAPAGWNPALTADNHLDSGPWAPRSVVVDPGFDWAGDTRPEVAWERSLIYECHVRGMTRLHPQVPADLRGTYLGLVQPPVLDHLHSLGVTALELLPVQHFTAERQLAERGRVNYWGYSPIGWFAPHAGFATAAGGEPVREFKAMVRELHRAGLEVILDVVFNHTAEGGADGLTLGPRGIDNANFYRLDPRDRARYVDLTGCGNTVDVRAGAALDLVIDALRYWARDMRVDGFRFDLAAVLGRGSDSFSPAAPFFRRVAADPLLSRLKLIAEPWDLGPGGHQLGGFADGWHEWNGRYRDAVRAFWRGDRSTLGEMATRLAGSSDLYAGRASGCVTGINFVACHDGFTLTDLVTYRRKRNWENGENNRDGGDHNRSHNWGIEGPTADPSIGRRRQRARKNLLASLALSAGVPMLGHGDELGRTQRGNNNAYCHDSELTWVDWDLAPTDEDLLAFTREVFQLRRRLGLFSRRRFFTSDELAWLRPDGRPLGTDDWEEPDLRALVAWLQPTEGPELALVLNGGPETHRVRLPTVSGGWRLQLATAADLEHAGDELISPGYSLAVLTAEDRAAAPDTR